MPRSAHFADDRKRMRVWAKVIKGLLTEKAHTPAEIADAADISRHHVYAFLKGEGSLSLPKIERILEFLGHELEAIGVQTVKVRHRERPVATRCNEVA